jgi:hypothetical protein
MTTEQPIQNTNVNEVSERTRNIALTKTKLVVCEGREETRFFPKLLEIYALSVGSPDISKDLQFIACEGKSNLEFCLEKELPVLPGWPNVTSLGIILDADSERTGSGFAPTLEKIKNAIGRIGFPTYPVPQGAGSAVSSNGLKTIIWVMPDNHSEGMLEDLCLRALDDHILVPCINAVEACASEAKGPAIRPGKARLYTLLAWLEPPGRRLGELDNSFVGSWKMASFQSVLTSFFYQL